MSVEQIRAGEYIRANIEKTIGDEAVRFLQDVSSRNGSGETEDLLQLADSEMRTEFEECLKGGKQLRGILFINYALSGSTFTELSRAWDDSFNIDELVFKNAEAKCPPLSAFLSATFRLGAALEVFQTAMLVHDDIIDRDVVRRGRPSSFKTLGPSRALLLGDLLVTFADSIVHHALADLLEGDLISSSVHTNFLQNWDRIKRDVLLGQAMDFRLSQTALDKLDPDGEGTLAEYVLNTARYKTASYTTVAPFLLGKILGENKALDVENLDGAVGDEYAKTLVAGVDFQFNNDIDDFEKDLRNGNLSCLLALSFSLSDDADRANILEITAKKGDVEEEKLERVRALLVKNAKEYNGK
ncbi:MAG: polyprenyl synthetase family protein [Candidatus Ancillula sp.]|nr:polyprenyl synthetase family protein [Candidatus Ancillula sp.]